MSQTACIGKRPVTGKTPDMTAHSQALTKNQTLVFEALSKTGAPMSAYTILDALRDRGFRAPPQVYRALDKLVESGLVHRLESLNAFVACAHEQCHKAGLIAFAICDDCGHVSEFSDRIVAERLAAWGEDNNFVQSKTTIEIRGACGDCSGARSRTPLPAI